MRNIHIATLVLALVGLLLAGCKTATQPLTDITIPFAGESVMHEIEGDPYRFFRYTTIEQAKQDLDKVSPDGKTIDGTTMPWDGPVHIFHLSKRIVIYIGSNPNTLQTIQSVFGKQVAGDAIEEAVPDKQPAPANEEAPAKP